MSTASPRSCTGIGGPSIQSDYSRIRQGLAWRPSKQGLFLAYPPRYPSYVEPGRIVLFVLRTYAASPESEWEFETDEDREFDERWDPIVGDRQTEIVFIGVDMDEAAIRARLDSCVVTGREFEKGPKKGA